MFNTTVNSITISAASHNVLQSLEALTHSLTKDKNVDCLHKTSQSLSLRAYSVCHYPSHWAKTQKMHGGGGGVV